MILMSELLLYECAITVDAILVLTPHVMVLKTILMVSFKANGLESNHYLYISEI